MSPFAEAPDLAMSEQIFIGHPVVGGVGRGEVVHLSGGLSLKQIGPQSCSQPGVEVLRFEAALAAAEAELAEITEYAQREVPEEVAIFEAMSGLLRDPTFLGMVTAAIERGDSAEWALCQVISHYEDEFSRISSQYLQERLSELQNVGVRIIAKLWGESGDRQVELSQNAIIVTYDLSATELLGLDTEHVKGLVLEKTYKTAHVVILAKSLNIPVVSGVRHALQYIPRACVGIVDGDSGMFYANPSVAVADRYDGYASRHLEITASYLEARAQPAVTRDDVAIELSFNVGTLREIDKARVYHAGGIGLFRTELFFLKAQHWPDEEEQLEMYREAVRLADGHTVVFRTLDLGGDKFLPYDMDVEEDDPFLGWRGIRRSLDNRDRFQSQLRALLRASAFGKLKIMLPFITTVSEVEQCQEMIAEVQAELSRSGIPHDEALEVGIMVETPAVVWQADVFAQAVDFFSIGTNDLIQFILAAGRSDEKVEALFDMYHQAIARAVAAVCDAAAEHELPVSVCGEAAGVPAMALFLIGNFRTLKSLSATSSQRCAISATSARRRPTEPACPRLTGVRQEHFVDSSCRRATV
jgi:phosphoenolpyruvate-protein phosphotransferase